MSKKTDNKWTIYNPNDEKSKVIIAGVVINCDTGEVIYNEEDLPESARVFWKYISEFKPNFIKQALQEQEERIREEEYQRRKEEKCETAEVNYQAGYARAKQEILQIVIEDVPHKYQERFLKELLLEFESNQLEGKGYDFYFAIRTKLDELLKD